MKKFNIRQLLLTTAVLSALFGWNHMRAKWREYRSITALDGEVVQTSDGPVSRLFRSKRDGYFDDRGNEVRPPPVSKLSGYLIVLSAFIVSSLSLRKLQAGVNSPIHLLLSTLQIMAMSIIAVELVLFTHLILFQQFFMVAR